MAKSSRKYWPVTADNEHVVTQLMDINGWVDRLAEHVVQHNLHMDRPVKEQQKKLFLRDAAVCLENVAGDWKSAVLTLDALEKLIAEMVREEAYYVCANLTRLSAVIDQKASQLHQKELYTV